MVFFSNKSHRIYFSFCSEFFLFYCLPHILIMKNIPLQFSSRIFCIFPLFSWLFFFLHCESACPGLPVPHLDESFTKTIIIFVGITKASVVFPAPLVYMTGFKQHLCSLRNWSKACLKSLKTLTAVCMRPLQNNECKNKSKNIY